MSIINGYITREQLVAEVAEGSTTIDTERLDRICYQASRIVDDWTQRRFYPVIETRYFSPDYTDVLWVDDLLSVTTLKSDDGGRTYSTTWATTDYDLEPYNADEKKQPYTALRLTPQSLQYFPIVRRGIEVVGKWGYFEETRTASATVSGVHTSSTTSLTTSAADEFDVGHILKIGSEYMRVDAVNTTTEVLTVARGINGSTAAALSGGEAIMYLAFPNIAEATMRLATRIWHLRKAPMGIATAGVQGFDGSTAGTRWIQHDQDLQAWLAPYRGGRML